MKGLHQALVADGDLVSIDDRLRTLSGERVEAGDGGQDELGVASAGGLLWFTERLGNRFGCGSPRAGSAAAVQASIAEFSVTGAGSMPTGIAAGPDGNVWFTENGAGGTGKRDPKSGEITEIVTEGARDPHTPMCAWPTARSTGTFCAPDPRYAASPVASRLGHLGGVLNYLVVIVLALAPAPRWPGTMVYEIAPLLAIFYLAAIIERGFGYRRRSNP